MEWVPKWNRPTYRRHLLFAPFPLGLLVFGRFTLIARDSYTHFSRPITVSDGSPLPSSRFLHRSVILGEPPTKKYNLKFPIKIWVTRAAVSQISNGHFSTGQISKRHFSSGSF